MNSKIKFLLYSVLIIGLSSCAVKYKPINISTYKFDQNELFENIELSYKYNILKESGNNKQATKETIHNLKILAVNITNHSESTIKIGDDIQFYFGETPIELIDNDKIYKKIKQKGAGYLPYLLLSFMNVAINDNRSYENQTRIGFPIAIGITGLNMIKSGTNNVLLLDDLKKYDIINKDILPGETISGIIGFKTFGYEYKPISYKIKNN